MLFLILLTECNDVFQYVWGRSLGKRRIVPAVSPNKTWTGFVGGVATTTVLAWLIGPYLTPMGRGGCAAAGAIISIAGFFGDVAMSALKRDLKIKETYQQLLQSEKLAGLGTMSAGIVHEVKNPMTAILSQAELLAMTLSADDPASARAQTIIKATLRCKDILDNLLKFARTAEPRFEPVRLHRVIDQLLTLIAAQLRVKKVEVASPPLTAKPRKLPGRESPAHVTDTGRPGPSVGSLPSGPQAA